MLGFSGKGDGRISSRTGSGCKRYSTNGLAKEPQSAWTTELLNFAKCKDRSCGSPRFPDRSWIDWIWGHSPLKAAYSTRPMPQDTQRPWIAGIGKDRRRQATQLQTRLDIWTPKFRRSRNLVMRSLMSASSGWAQLTDSAQLIDLNIVSSPFPAFLLSQRPRYNTPSTQL
jgi:hypothetical protein